MPIMMALLALVQADRPAIQDERPIKLADSSENVVIFATQLPKEAKMPKDVREAWTWSFYRTPRGGYDAVAGKIRVDCGKQTVQPLRLEYYSGNTLGRTQQLPESAPKFASTLKTEGKVMNLICGQGLTFVKPISVDAARALARELFRKNPPKGA